MDDERHLSARELLTQKIHELEAKQDLTATDVHDYLQLEIAALRETSADPTAPLIALENWPSFREPALRYFLSRTMFHANQNQLKTAHFFTRFSEAIVTEPIFYYPKQEVVHELYRSYFRRSNRQYKLLFSLLNSSETDQEEQELLDRIAINLVLQRAVEYSAAQFSPEIFGGPDQVDIEAYKEAFQEVLISLTIKPLFGRN